MPGAGDAAAGASSPARAAHCGGVSTRRKSARPSCSRILATGSPEASASGPSREPTPLLTELDQGQTSPVRAVLGKPHERPPTGQEAVPKLIDVLEGYLTALYEVGSQRSLVVSG
jgi:hypothetical protein